MRKALASFVCIIFTLFCFSAANAQTDLEAELETEIELSANDSTNSSELDNLLLELTQVSLNGTIDVLEQLERVGGKDLLPLFQTMLAGNLYYNEETLELVAVVEISDNVEIAYPVFSPELTFDADTIETSRIRLNNRIRTYLRSMIAEIQLMEGSVAERISAVRNIIADIDEDNVLLLEQVRALETEARVLELIEVGIALFQIQSSVDLESRMAALTILDGRLEAAVRNTLRRYLTENAIAEQEPEFTEAVEDVVTRIEDRIGFYDFIEQIFFGLSLGSVLLLIAIGLAVTFGVMGVINMAHGEMLMLGAYTTFVVQQIMPNYITASIWVAIPAAFLVSATVGVIIQRFVIRYLIGRPLETLLATFGISLILQQTVRTIFSPLNRRVITPDWMSGSWQINPVFSLTYNRLYILIFSIIIFAILLLILKKTALGLYVRAVSQNRSMAKAMGIKTDLVDAMTFGLGSGIAGIGGVALSQLTNVGPNLGQTYIIDSFMVVVFGGVGNLYGTLVAAFSLGVFNKFLEPVTGTVLASILVLVFIILFIQKRPKGLFPQKGRAAE